MHIRFVKYHGLGNDFVVVDGRQRDPKIPAHDVEAICTRHRGVGADGVLTVLSDPTADAVMRVQNADGSESQMCGNGIRCVARYLLDDGGLTGDQLTIRAGETLHPCQRVTQDTFRVDMGTPQLVHDDLPPQANTDGDTVMLALGGKQFPATCLHFGNPHAVIFIDDDPQANAKAYGAHLESHPAFRNRVNATFARVVGNGVVDAVVYERGVGITQACGSGACAVGVAAVLRKHGAHEQPITVRLPGGPLVVSVSHDFQVSLEGEAQRVFLGEWGP